MTVHVGGASCQLPTAEHGGRAKFVKRESLLYGYELCSRGTIAPMHTNTAQRGADLMALQFATGPTGCSAAEFRFYEIFDSMAAVLTTLNARSEL
jgi:hypothetical protein